MKELKNEKSPEFNMQEDWRKLNPQDQEIVTNFFNVHNLAHLLYTLGTEDAQAYINNCIMMQSRVEKAEKEQEQ